MDNKRKACYLLIMLLVDSFNIGMPHTIPTRVARDIDTSDADSSPTLEDDAPGVLEVVEYIMTNSADVAQAGEIMDQLDELLSSSADTAKSFITDTLKTAMIESEVVSLESTASVSCGELSENYAPKIHDDVPGSSEMEEFSLLLVYVTFGCVVESSAMIDDLVSRFDGPDELLEVLLEFIDGLQDSDSEGSLDSQDSGVGTSKTLLSNVTSPITVQEVLSSLLRVMEPLLFETAQEPKLCKWTLLSADGCDVLPGGVPSYTTLSDAQIACERLHEACSGVTGNDTFALVELCTNAHQIEAQTYYSDLYWQKDCESISSSTASPVSRVKKAYEIASVTLYEHSEYSGRTKDFAPTDSMVDFVGDDFSDIVSSLECRPTPCSVITFENIGFTGFQIAYENRTNVVGTKHNDRFSSLVLLPFSLSVLCFEIYPANSFSGTPEKVCGDALFSPTRTIRSLKFLCSECSVILYKGGYEGAFTTITSDVSAMDVEWVEVHSVQIRPWNYGTYQGHLNVAVTFYEHTNYSGRSQLLREKVDFVGERMNDVYSSFKCNGKCNVLAFEHHGFEGVSILYQSSQSHLSQQNDVISSVLIIPYEVCVTVYEHRYFQGHSQRFCADVFDLTKTIFQDEISSLSVECDHCSVIVYEHANNQGRYKYFRGKISYVGESWNDIISSIQIRPWKLDIESFRGKISYGGESRHVRKRDIGTSNLSKCQANPKEQKTYNIVQYIPILSILYTLGTSSYYGAIGCDSVAKSRAVDLAIDVGVAVVTAVTAGTGTGAVYGAKVAMKSGLKAGIKAFGKAAGAIAKNNIKNGVKTGLKRATKKVLKKTLTKKVHAVKSLAKIPSKLKKSVINVVKHVKKNGVKESVKDAGTKFTKSVRKAVTQCYQKAKISGPGLSRCFVCEWTAVEACSRMITEILRNTSAYNQAENRYIEQMNSTQKGRDLADAYDELYRDVAAPPLDKSEYISLGQYTKDKGNFSEVNKRLRGGSFADEDVVLQNLLTKSPKLGRNTKLVRFEGEWPGSEAFYTGNTITYPSFLSTSTNLRLEKSNIPRSYDWERYYRIEISKPRDGVEVGNLMKPTRLEKNQGEVLFPAGSIFNVKYVSDWQRDSSGKLYKLIKLEQ